MLRAAGGVTLNISGSATFYYGSFYSILDQSDGADTIIPMYAENTYDANGVSMANNGAGDPSLITFDHAGTYSIQFSTVFHDAGGGGAGKTVNVWYRHNGNTIANSNTLLSIANSSPYVVASWNFIYSVAAGDTIEIVWQTPNTQIQADYIAASGNIPATPSVIISAIQIT